MKKKTKIIAILMAFVMMIMSFSVNVFATCDTCNDAICTDHPDGPWHTYPQHVGIRYYHEYYCDVCGNKFCEEDCIFYYSHDCRDQPYCIMCDQLDMDHIYDEHEFGEWKHMRDFHYRNCKHTDVDCTADEKGAHTYIQTVIGGITCEVCTICGYYRTK